MNKFLNYIHDNTEALAAFCAAAFALGTIFLAVYLGKREYIVQMICVVSFVVYRLVMDSNYRTRKK